MRKSLEVGTIIKTLLSPDWIKEIMKPVAVYDIVIH